MLSHRLTQSLLLVLWIFLYSCSSQTPPPASDEAQRFIDQLISISELDSKAEREKVMAKLWNELESAGNIPWRNKDHVVFLYKGEVNDVQWQGDFSSWGGQRAMKTKGTRLNDLPYWYWHTTLPADARVDYKVVINGKDWILDPSNPDQQWTGVGGGSPNSELRMPEFKPNPRVAERLGVAKGKLSDAFLINSSSLGYDLSYQLYFPPNYIAQQPLPILYVLDGQEYVHPKLGRINVVADNLWKENLIEPFIMVLLSPENPTNKAQNRRFDEFTLNKKFHQFFIKELIPSVEAQLNLNINASDRGILGTSLGGLTSTWFMATTPNVFGRIGIHSPAYWIKKAEIFNAVEQSTSSPKRVFISAGSINDDWILTNEMTLMFKSKGIDYKEMTIPQGHSWGNWAWLTDETLIHLFGK